MRCPVDYISIVQEKTKNHDGVDFGYYSLLHRGMPVCAIDDGVVIYNRYQSTGGYVIHIRHNNGTVSEYGHLKKNSQKVLEGDKVKKGQMIARMGATGKVTGMHLHLGLYKGTKINYSNRKNWLDPLKYINVYDGQTENNKSKGKIKHTKHAQGIPSEPLLVHNEPNFNDSSIVKGMGIYNGDQVETYGTKNSCNVIDNLRNYYCSNKYLK